MGTLHAQTTAQILKKVGNGLHDIASRIGIGYTPGQSTIDPRGRRRRLPPTPHDFWEIIDYGEFDSAIRWLSLSGSTADAAELSARVKSLQRRFHRAHITACKLLNGDPIDATETIGINYAIPILSDLHYQILHDRFPDMEEEPSVEELQPDLRLSNAILNEYHAVKSDLREVAKALLTTAAIIGGREIEEDGPAGVCEVRWRGKVHKCLKETQWRFFEALWKAPNRTASLDDLAEPVNGDATEVPLEGTAKGWASRVNKCFRDNDPAIPIRISGTKGVFSVVIEES